MAHAVSTAFGAAFHRSITMFDKPEFRAGLLRRLRYWTTGTSTLYTSSFSQSYADIMLLGVRIPMVDDWKPLKIPVTNPVMSHDPVSDRSRALGPRRSSDGGLRPPRGLGSENSTARSTRDKDLPLLAAAAGAAGTTVGVSITVSEASTGSREATARSRRSSLSRPPPSAQDSKPGTALRTRFPSIAGLSLEQVEERRKQRHSVSAGGLKPTGPRPQPSLTSLSGTLERPTFKLNLDALTTGTTVSRAGDSQPKEKARRTKALFKPVEYEVNWLILIAFVSYSRVFVSQCRCCRCHRL